MTNISKVLRARLEEVAEIRAPEIVARQHSRDGTRKWLLRVDGDNSVEMVFIPEKGRGTLCVSSQVGCALDCSFCSTARQGFNRNLSAAEIIGHAGVVPALLRLREVSDASLAVSLHAPDDALRDRLVPINRKYPIAELLRACRAYVSGETKRGVTFEYVMLHGVNDSEEQARQLARLLNGIPSKVNLIPFNPFPGSRYTCSPPEVIERFASILQERGIVTIVRRTRGEDIDAACGQLVGRVRDRTRRNVIPVREAC